MCDIQGPATGREVSRKSSSVPSGWIRWYYMCRSCCYDTQNYLTGA